MGLFLFLIEHSWQFNAFLLCHLRDLLSVQSFFGFRTFFHKFFHDYLCKRDKVLASAARFRNVGFLL